jgi:precorrin-2 dehydrogenase/sirohydrochlorin ferrochelatase
MIPVFLDPALTRVALIGRGRLTVRRLHWLRACGADPAIFSDAPEPELLALAGAALHARLPRAEEIKSFHALWIADLDADTNATLADHARAAGVLVNVEDVKEFCDFHTPAVVHRGRLTLAAGTGGSSPAVASAVRERLETTFPERWAAALEEIAAARLSLQAAGASPQEVIADAQARIKALGL